MSIAHRQKRLYQPSLSTYLPRSSSSSSSYSSSASSLTFSTSLAHNIFDDAQRQQHPPLPSTIQSSLLSVGMRVRKAVPEGYKTLDDAKKNEDQENGPWDAGEAAQRRSISINKGTGNARKELAPYCAILDVGGLNAGESRDYGGARDEEERVPELIFDEEDGDWLSGGSSQQFMSSLPGTVRPSQSSTSRKRGFEDGDLHDPMSADQFNLDGKALRPIAQPRSRKPCRGQGYGTIREEDEEMRDLKTSVVDDFEDADFLQPV